jgi:hypothetical protein
MPRIHPGTLIIELEPLSMSTLTSLLSDLVKQGVLEVLVATAPSVVDVSIGGNTYSVAIAPFTVLVTPTREISLLSGVRVYVASRDAWVDAVKLSTSVLLGVLTALSRGDTSALLDYGIVVESGEYCEDVLFAFPLTVKSTDYSSLRKHSVARAYGLYREVLSEQKVLLAVCVSDSTMSPYAWIEKRGGRVILVLKNPRGPSAERVSLRIILDYVVTNYSKTESIRLQELLS